MGNASALGGQVCLITGAGQGIGAAVAMQLARDGAAVALCDLDIDASLHVAQTIVNDGGRAIGIEVDVVKEEDVAAAAAQTEQRFGPITVWVNNAGVSRPAMLHNMTHDEFEFVLRVHVHGTFHGMREAARRMRKSGVAGAIINVTSSAGLDGTIGQINYAAAKGAIVGMTKSGARELARSKIRVNAVCPLAATPMTETIRLDERFAARYLERIPLGRWAMPEEVATAFRFLAGPESSYVTGQVLCVDGGMHMAS